VARSNHLRLAPQLFLDPANLKADSVCERSPRIPETIQAFGHLPDITAWQPGDFLLVSAINTDIIQRSIYRFQRRSGYTEEDARWHHAAVYIGDYDVCEATRSGVHVRKLFHYVGNHLLNLRTDPTLAPDDSWRVAIQALVRLKYSYSFPRSRNACGKRASALESPRSP
jgi:hypothetical protein